LFNAYSAGLQCPSVWPGVQHRKQWNFDDPAAYAGAEDEKLEKFREIRNQNGVAINAFIESERMQHGANRTPESESSALASLCG
jgi:hypothetical protein